MNFRKLVLEQIDKDPKTIEVKATIYAGTIKPIYANNEDDDYLSIMDITSVFQAKVPVDYNEDFAQRPKTHLYPPSVSIRDIPQQLIDKHATKGAVWLSGKVYPDNGLDMVDDLTPESDNFL